MKKIAVPKGMLKAAILAVDGKFSCIYMPSKGLGGDFAVIEAMGLGLEAALRWMSDNPIVPTEEQWRACLQSYNDAAKTGYECALLFCNDWQRRMFLAPEPEVPEAVADLRK